MTPSELQAALEANTETIARLSSAVDVLVSQFIRPSAQQALSNYERIERIEGLVLSIAEQQAVNTAAIAANNQQIADNAAAITAFDERLEETRQLVAQNGSDIAQIKVAQSKNDEQINRNAADIAAMVEENRAFRELQQSQLAAIIGNGRRIDRLEQQQAS